MEKDKLMDVINSSADSIIGFALTMWANYIESGDPCLSSADVARAGGKVKALSTDQMAVIVKLRQMAVAHYTRNL